MKRFTLFLFVCLLSTVAFAQDIPPATQVPVEGTPLLNLFIQYGLPLVAVPILGLLIMLMWKGVAWVDAHAKTSKVASVLAPLAHFAASVVDELDKTMRPKFLAAAADGKITAEEKLALRNEAIEILKAKLPSGLLTAATATFGGLLNATLGSLVDRAVIDKRTAELGTVAPVGTIITVPTKA